MSKTALWLLSAADDVYEFVSPRSYVADTTNIITSVITDDRDVFSVIAELLSFSFKKEYINIAKMTIIPGHYTNKMSKDAKNTDSQKKRTEKKDPSSMINH